MAKPAPEETDFTGAESAEDLDAKSRKSVGYPALIAGLVLASLLGAAGGGAAAYYLNAKPADLSPLQTELAQLEQSLAALKSEMKSDQAKRAARPSAKVDLSGVTARLDALENALENAPTQSPAPPTEISLDNLDPETLASLRAALRTGEANSAPFSEPLPDMTEIEARLEALENRPAPILKSAPAADTPTTQIPFPKTALITAAEGRQKQGGFFKRQMDKHIRVKDANDPLVLIEAIETALSENDMDTAKAKFDQLPSQIRSAGQSWRESLN